VRDLARTAWHYRFDKAGAANVCGFIEKLPHVEGRWSTPTIRLEPWQVFNPDHGIRLAPGRWFPPFHNGVF
jgi:hypothetical protein